MNTRIGWLIGIAVLQIIVIAVLWFGGSGSEEPDALLEFDREQVTHLEVADADEQVTLTKDASGWSVNELPADQDQVEEILSKLSELDAPWPIASSAESARRFEVAEDNFQRRVILKNVDGETLTQLYLGTSPGYQRVHARREADDRVYSVPLSNYELGVGVDDWLDKAIFAVAQAPQSISVELVDEASTTRLEKVEEGWLLNGEASDSDAVQSYADRFTNLRVLGVAQDTDGLTQLASITVDGTQLDIHRLGEEGDYVLGTTPPYFRVATYLAEQLLMQDADFAIKAPVEEASESVEENVN